MNTIPTLKSLKRPATQEIVLPILLLLVLIPLPYWEALQSISYQVDSPFIKKMAAWLIYPKQSMPLLNYVGPMLLVGWLLYVVWRGRGPLYAALPVAGGLALSYGFGLWLCGLFPQAGSNIRYLFYLFCVGYGRANIALLAIGLLVCMIAWRRRARPAAGWRALRPLGFLALAVVAFYALAPVLMAFLAPWQAGGAFAVTVLHTAASRVVWFVFILLLGVFSLRRGLHPLWIGLFYSSTLILAGTAFSLVAKFVQLRHRLLQANPDFAAIQIADSFKTAATNGFPAIFLALCILAFAQKDRLMAVLLALGTFWSVVWPVAWYWSRLAEIDWPVDIFMFYLRVPFFLYVRPPLILLFALQGFRSTRRGHPLLPTQYRGGGSAATK